MMSLITYSEMYFGILILRCISSFKYACMACKPVQFTACHSVLNVDRCDAYPMPSKTEDNPIHYYEEFYTAEVQVYVADET